MKKKKENDFDSYIEDIEEVSEKEQELIDSYKDEEIKSHLQEKEKKEQKLRKANEKILEEEYDDDDLEEYEIEDDFKEEKQGEYEEYLEPKKKINWNKVSNIIFIILFILLLLSIIDVLCVAKLNKGPFFAIPLHTYDDGGTKEYYGLGYKVIKYNQVQGRRDMELGTWSLKYNVDPIYTELLDLAIEFHDNEKEAYSTYYKKLLVVSGTLKEINAEKNQITMEYVDEGGKYSMNLVCNMETDKEKLSIMEPGYEVSAMGTMMNYESKTKDKVSTIYLDNCFAEQ